MRNVCSRWLLPNFLIAGPGLARRTPAAGEREDLEYPDLAVERKRDHRPDADILAALCDPPPVNPDMAGLDQPLGKGPALHQPDEIEKAIKPHLPLSA